MKIVTPILGIDGNMWYLLLGGDLMMGSVSFGKTINETILDFEKSYNCQVDLRINSTPKDMTTKQYKEWLNDEQPTQHETGAE